MRVESTVLRNRFGVHLGNPMRTVLGYLNRFFADSEKIGVSSICRLRKNEFTAINRHAGWEK